MHNISLFTLYVKERFIYYVPAKSWKWEFNVKRSLKYYPSNVEYFNYLGNIKEGFSRLPIGCYYAYTTLACKGVET